MRLSVTRDRSGRLCVLDLSEFWTKLIYVFDIDVVLIESEKL